MFPFAKFYISLSEEINVKLELSVGMWYVWGILTCLLYARTSYSLYVVASYSDHLYDNPDVHFYSPQQCAKHQVSS